MRIALLLLVATGCTDDSTALADVRNASIGLQIWDCGGPNVPLGCAGAFSARVSIGGDGIGARFSSPCVTLSDDARATIDDVAMQNVFLGGEHENSCEGVVFLEDWAARPADVPTSEVAIADGSATLAMDVTRLFGERRIDIVTPARPLQRGDHVEAQLVLPSAMDTIEPASVFVCNGDCPAYLPYTISGNTIQFDVPANAAGPIKMGAHVVIPIERCDGVVQCSAIASVSVAAPVAP